MHSTEGQQRTSRERRVSSWDRATSCLFHRPWILLYIFHFGGAMIHCLKTNHLHPIPQNASSGFANVCAWWPAKEPHTEELSSRLSPPPDLPRAPAHRPPRPQREDQQHGARMLGPSSQAEPIITRLRPRHSSAVVEAPTWRYEALSQQCLTRFSKSPS